MYQHTTWTQLQTALSARLGDTSQRFWIATEIEDILTEALRTFGLCSGFWRERGSFNTTASTAFYSINSLLATGTITQPLTTGPYAGKVLNPSVTDRDVIRDIELALLETVNTVGWSGTEQFTQADMASAVQNRLNQFMADTGCVVTRAVSGAISPQVSRETLSQSTVDVRRVAWLGSAPEAYYSTLWRDDERMLTAADASWSTSPGKPQSYSVMATPPLSVQIAPPPISAGQLELLTVDSKVLDPANTDTILGIPDDLTPAIKWGALSDLLGKDGIAADPIRSMFCEQRYRQFVMLARMLPVVIHAEIDGRALIPSTLQEMDSSTPDWQNIASNGRNPVQDLIIASTNLVALSAVPSTVHSVTMDVVRSAPIPYNGTDYVQIGREQVDMILDYAEHIAMFKCAGQEFRATGRQADNFMLQSVTYNQRISASARAVLSAAFQSEKQKTEVPRRVEAWLGKTFGVGALTVGD